ncbi:MAG: hypothetical protein RL757_1023 [Bacteroidota bacterium]|jgi:WD40 repeat protein
MRIEIEKKAQLLGHNAAIYALDVSENAIWTGGGDAWLVRWDVDQPELGRLVAKTEKQIFSLQKLAFQSKILVGDMDGGVRLIDLEQPDASVNIAHHGGKGTFASLQISENSLLSIGGNGVLTRWQIAPFRSVESIQLSRRSLRAIAYAPTRGWLAVGGSDGHIFLLDKNLNVLTILKNAFEKSIFSMEFSSDEKILIAGGRDAVLKIWNIENVSFSDSDTGGEAFSLLKTINAHWFTINAIAMHPKLPIFATASRDKTIKIWSSETFELLKVVDTIRHGCHIRSVNRLAWADDAETLVSVSDDRSAIVWSVKMTEN